MCIIGLLCMAENCNANLYGFFFFFFFQKALEKYEMGYHGLEHVLWWTLQTRKGQKKKKEEEEEERSATKVQHYASYCRRAYSELENKLCYHMTHTAQLAQSYRKPYGKLTCVGPDGLTWAGPEKAVRPCTRTALWKKIYCETKFTKTILILNKQVFRINIEEKNLNAIQISPA